jgi:hypothetical protein
VINSIRARLAEFGIVAPVGRQGVEQLLGIVADPNDKRVPEVARVCIAALGAQLRVLKADADSHYRQSEFLDVQRARQKAEGADAMVRYYHKDGRPEWTEPMTDEEKNEQENYAFNGMEPFASIPAKADRTNVTPFPLLRRKLKKLVRLQS